MFKSMQFPLLTSVVHLHECQRIDPSMFQILSLQKHVCPGSPSVRADIGNRPAPACTCNHTYSICICGGQTEREHRYKCAMCSWEKVKLRAVKVYFQHRGETESLGFCCVWLTSSCRAGQHRSLISSLCSKDKTHVRLVHTPQHTPPKPVWQTFSLQSALQKSYMYET